MGVTRSCSKVPTFTLAHDRAGRQDDADELKQHGDEPRDDVVRRPALRVEEDDGVGPRSRLAGDDGLEAREVVIGDEPVDAREGLGARRRVGAVDEHEHLSRRSADAVVMEPGRDDDRDARTPRANLLAGALGIRRDVDDLERLGGAELILEQAAVDRMILIDDAGRQVVNGLVDEAEEDELHDRQHERQAQRAGVAEDVQELLAEDCEERAPHVRPPLRRANARRPR